MTLVCEGYWLHFLLKRDKRKVWIHYCDKYDAPTEDMYFIVNCDAFCHHF